MRLGYLMSLAIIPSIIAFTSMYNQEHQKDKHSKGREHSENHNDDYENDDEDNRYYGHDQDEKGKKEKNHENDNGEKYYNKQQKEIEKSYKKYDDKKYKENERWDDGKWDDDRFNDRMHELKAHKEGKKNKQIYNTGIDWFTGQKYYEVKNPSQLKKVTICHKPNGSKYPVTIDVSENALKAHLNHGDYLGECKDWDRSRYSDTYWNTRTNYYNQYAQTTETLSLGQQLLALAINKLTNSQQLLTAQRPRLTSSQISERELAIINLQNDTYDLRNSLDRGSNRAVNVNFRF